MLFLLCVCYAFMSVCLLLPCSHMVGKGWPLRSRLWCHIGSLLLSLWYPGAGVVIDYIDSWYLPSFVPIYHKNKWVWAGIVKINHDWVGNQTSYLSDTKCCSPLLPVYNVWLSFWIGGDPANLEINNLNHHKMSIDKPTSTLSVCNRIKKML